MNKIYITKDDKDIKEKFDLLYNTSALTMEGLCEDSIIDFINWIKQYSNMTSENVHIIKGETMNYYYNLSGNNAYSNDLTIVSISNNQIKELDKIIIPRFEIGARWFDDIVDNNLRREQSI